MRQRGLSRASVVAALLVGGLTLASCSVVPDPADSDAVASGSLTFDTAAPTAPPAESVPSSVPDSSASAAPTEPSDSSTPPAPVQSAKPVVPTDQAHEGAAFAPVAPVPVPPISGLPSMTVSVVGRISGYRLNASRISYLRVYLYAPDADLETADPLRVTTPASTGAFRFDAVPAGTYQLKIRSLNASMEHREFISVRPPARTVNVTLDAVDWQSRDADLSGDGLPDLIARDPAGTVWVYPGDGKGRITGKYAIATGWGSMTALVRPGDWDEDGFADLIARDTAGTMWVYPGDGQGGLKPRVQLTTGWGQYRVISAVSGYQFEGIGCLLPLDPDRHNVWLFCRDSLGNFSEQRPDPLGGTVYGELYSYYPLSSVAGTGDFLGLGRPGFFHWSTWPPEFGGSWEFTAAAKMEPFWYRPFIYGEPWVSDVAFAGAGDFDGNFRGDMVSQDAAGKLWLVRSSGSVYNQNSVSVSRTLIGTGFKGYTLFR